MGLHDNDWGTSGTGKRNEIGGCAGNALFIVS